MTLVTNGCSVLDRIRTRKNTDQLTFVDFCMLSLPRAVYAGKDTVKRVAVIFAQGVKKGRERQAKGGRLHA